MNLSVDERTLAVFEEIGEELAGRGVSVGKMFGLPCLKAGSKVFAGAFGDAMVFKLAPEPRAAAMKLKGARLFNPSGMGRPMKEWVEVLRTRWASWGQLAEAARAYVAH